VPLRGPQRLLRLTKQIGAGRQGILRGRQPTSPPFDSCSARGGGGPAVRKNSCAQSPSTPSSCGRRKLRPRGLNIGRPGRDRQGRNANDPVHRGPPDGRLAHLRVAGDRLVEKGNSTTIEFSKTARTVFTANRSNNSGADDLKLYSILQFAFLLAYHPSGG